MIFAVKEKFVYVTGGGLFKAYSIFIQATEDNKQDLVRFLIESGIDINSRIKNNAAFIGYHEIVKLLLTVPGIDVNAEDNFQVTSLIGASRNNRYEVVKILLTVPGIEINAKDKYNWTALMYASKEGHHEVVKLLLTVPGIDVNAKDINNKTAMNLALRNNHYEIVKIL